MLQNQSQMAKGKGKGKGKCHLICGIKGKRQSQRQSQMSFNLWNKLRLMTKMLLKNSCFGSGLNYVTICGELCSKYRKCSDNPSGGYRFTEFSGRRRDHQRRGLNKTKHQCNSRNCNSFLRITFLKWQLVRITENLGCIKRQLLEAFIKKSILYRNTIQPHGGILLMESEKD